MRKGQISIDLLFSIVIFLVVIGILLGYVNNFDDVSKNYADNLSGFTNYIQNYDLVKSLDYMSFNSQIYFEDLNFGYDSQSKSIIFDSNNFYLISTRNFSCNLDTKVCSK